MAKTREAGAARQSAPAASTDSNVPQPSLDISAYNSLFVSMVLGMSWQLAVVVVVPIVGGHLLDLRQKTDPLFTLIGLVIAIAGVCLVLWRTVREANTKVAMLNTKESKR